MKNTPYWNLVYSREIIQHLLAQGIEDFCIAPGSRSTPLVLALHDEQKALTHVHYDERGLGFFAVGLSIAKKSPVAVIVTSGTAVANLMPAVIEAYYSRIPLIVITADRPTELRQCEANQTIHQVDLFGKHVHYGFDFSPPSEELDFGYISTQISQAIHAAMYCKGPVHLNMMFKEPFIGNWQSQDIQTSYPALQFSLPRLEADPFDVKALADLVYKKPQGMIIVGSEMGQHDLLQIAHLSQHLGFPVVPEILSNFHLASHEFIPHIDAILKGSLPPSFQPDHILFFGHRLISKTLLEWIKRLPLSSFVQIAPEASYYNPLHRLSHKFTCSAASFCDQMIPLLPPNNSSEFTEKWKELSSFYTNAFASYPQQDVEWQFFHQISYLAKGLPLFIANSMPIRYMNMIYNPHVTYTHVNANRGAAGIDGNIGTSIGLCKGRNLPLISLIGDQTALHDINSLHLAKNVPGYHLVIMNNSGGNIFSHLPIGREKGPFEKFFFSRHAYSFAPIAAMYSLPYQCISSLSELSSCQWGSTSSLIEIQLSAEESNQDYAKMIEEISTSPIR